VVVSTSKALDESERARLERYGAGFLSKSRLSEGTAALELRRICSGMGLGDLLPEPAQPVAQAVPPAHLDSFSDPAGRRL
jgi:hypothetical protein